jgi:hypothetical protein
MKTKCEICREPIPPSRNGRYCPKHRREVNLAKRRDKAALRKSTHQTVNKRSYAMLTRDEVAVREPITTLDWMEKFRPYLKANEKTGISYGQMYAPAVTIERWKM